MGCSIYDVLRHAKEMTPEEYDENYATLCDSWQSIMIMTAFGDLVRNYIDISLQVYAL